MVFIFILVPILLLVNLPRAEAARTFKKALPGYKYSFPGDHGSHVQFKTEWWYFTGHLKADSGEDYGFELTFFRTASDERPSDKQSAFRLDNIYLAHFAITDKARGKFSFFEKLNRKGLGLADARENFPLVYNQSWSMKFVDKDTIVLSANGGDYKLDLVLDSLKKPVIHGKDGVSQKASCKGCASHYYSLSRLSARGVLSVADKPVFVRGSAWMDHEFGSNQLTDNQVGWDWFSIQLDDNREIMLYVMRRADGGIDEHSSGTIVYADGRYRHLAKNEFIIKTERNWQSKRSGGRYPMGWNVSIPSEALSMRLSPVMDDQELATGKSTGVTYWEGAAVVSDSSNKKGEKEKLSGKAYIEMTGYAERFRKKI